MTRSCPMLRAQHEWTLELVMVQQSQQWLAEAPPCGRKSCFPRSPFSNTHRPEILLREASSRRLCVRAHRTLKVATSWTVVAARASTECIDVEQGTVFAWELEARSADKPLLLLPHLCQDCEHVVADVAVGDGSVFCAVTQGFPPV